MSPLRVGRWVACSLLLTLAPAATAEPPGRAKPRLDHYGDPLPPGAVARLGTSRFYQHNAINPLAFSSDTRLVATVDSVERGLFRGGMVRVAEVATGKQLWGFTGKSPFCSTPVFSADGRHLAVARPDDVLLWDARTGRQGRRFPMRDGGRSLVWLAPNGKTMAAAGDLGDIVWWSTPTGKVQRRWGFFNGKKPPRNEGPFAKPLIFSSDGQTVVYGVSGQKTVGGEWWNRELITARDTRSGKVLWTHEIDDWAIKTFSSVGADSRYATTRIADSITLRALMTGKELRKLKGTEGAEGGRFGLTISADGKWIASAHRDDSVCLWEAGTGKLRQRIKVRGEGLLTLALSGNGKVLATARGNWLRLWDTTTGKERPAFEGHREPVRGVAFTSKGSAYSVSRQLACSWDSTTWKETGRFDVGEWLAGSVEKGTILVAEKDGSVGVRDLKTAKLLRKFPVEARKCGGGEFSSDGKVVALLYGRGDEVALAFHHADSGKVFGRIAKIDKPEFLEFSADGTTLVWWGRDGLVWLADARTGKGLRSLGKKITGKRAGSVKHRVAVAPDGRRLAIVPRLTRERADEAGIDGRLRLLEVATGKEILSFEGVPDHVETLTFSPDGRMLAAGSLDSPLVRVWETATGRERFRLAGHRDCVRCLTFSPDGKLLLSGSDDGTVLVWDVRRPARD